MSFSNENTILSVNLSLFMPSPIRPGAVFDHLQEIRKDFRRERVLFTVEKPLNLGLFSIPYDWTLEACDYARAIEHSSSYPEFWDGIENSTYFRVIHRMHVEFISAGNGVVLLLNTCPVAQVDVKGDYGMAVFFDFPAMSKEEWELWELLGGSTVHFKILKDDKHLKLARFKEEEGMLNTLQMNWEVNLTTGETKLDVVSKLHRLPADPNLKNLIDWIGVRSGHTHPSILEYRNYK